MFIVQYVRHGEARRRLGEVLVTVLDEVKESSKAEMKAAAFGALQNLVQASSRFAQEILKRLEVHPQVAPAAVVLLGVLCEAVDPQPGLLELCAGPAKQFSKQIRDELGWARAPVASAVLALLPEG
eukprot:g14910.t1